MAESFPLQQILDRFGGRVVVDEAVTDMPCLKVAPDDLVALCRYLRDEAELKFNFMSDICGVDFYPQNPRFEVVYHLFSIPFGWRIRLKCRLGEPLAAPTITGVWPTANWHEREAYDMYGIVFEGHPDLRRIYMWAEFEGFPMRKDFPLRGYKDKYNPLGAARDDGVPGRKGDIP